MEILYDRICLINPKNPAGQVRENHEEIPTQARLSSGGLPHELRKASTPLVYVWIGDRIPEWATTAMAMSEKYCRIPIVLIASKAATQAAGIKNAYNLEDFYRRDPGFASLFPSEYANFRDGFWIKTLERFFVLEAFSEHFDIDKFFHAELDNLIFDISSLGATLDNAGKGFFCPRDSARGIASLIYVNDASRIKHMNEWFINHSGTVQNEMALLGEMLNHQQGFFALPTESALGTGREETWQYLKTASAGGIFDAAAMGQYLFGIDPRNTDRVLMNGFINEHALIDLGKLHFNFEADESALFVRHGARNQPTRCYNPHIHSKVFDKLSNPKWFNRVLENSNQGKKSLISLNMAQWKISRRLEARIKKSPG